MIQQGNRRASVVAEFLIAYHFCFCSASETVAHIAARCGHIELCAWLMRFEVQVRRQLVLELPSLTEEARTAQLAALLDDQQPGTLFYELGHGKLGTVS